MWGRRKWIERSRPHARTYHQSSDQDKLVLPGRQWGRTLSLKRGTCPHFGSGTDPGPYRRVMQRCRRLDPQTTDPAFVSTGFVPVHHTGSIYPVRGSAISGKKRHVVGVTKRVSCLVSLVAAFFFFGFCRLGSDIRATYIGSLVHMWC